MVAWLFQKVFTERVDMKKKKKKKKEEECIIDDNENVDEKSEWEKDIDENMEHQHYVR